MTLKFIEINLEYHILMQSHYLMHYMLKALYKHKIDCGSCMYEKWHHKEDYLKFLEKELLKLINTLEVLIMLIQQKELLIN